jgi:hypothetical protein
MTPRMSVRAQAQEIYREMVAGKADALSAATPTPDPSPQGGGGQAAARGEGGGTAGEGGATTSAAAPDLTARIRALYEETSVPVREIASVAGVTERTIYKYVERHGWKKRYRVTPRNEAAAAAHRGRRWEYAEGFAPAKGAGGRFIRREDKDKPFATGLKATDPAGAERALADCERAEPRARAAQAKAEAEMRFEERLRAMAEVNRAVAELKRYRERCAKDRAEGRPPAPNDERLERALVLSVRVATDWWMSLQ